MLKLFTAISGLYAVPILLAACATSAEKDGLSCAPPSGWAPVAAAAEGGVLLIGERHGTEEIPAAVSEYVCAVAAQGGRTLVGLEIDSGLQAPLAAARQSDDPNAALSSALATHWGKDDGRGSEAMLALLTDLLLYPGTDVVFFDDVGEAFARMASDRLAQRDFSASSLPAEAAVFQQARSEAMAQRLSQQMNAAPYSRIVVLTGGVHAVKVQYEELAGIDSMAMLLPEGTLSLTVLHDGGTAWGITDATTGPAPVKPSKVELPDGTPFPSVAFAPDLVTGFDGYLYVGPLTASPPALPQEKD
jgi:hypothetical protein